MLLVAVSVVVVVVVASPPSSMIVFCNSNCGEQVAISLVAINELDRSNF